MKLEHLNYLIVLSETKSITKAAVRLYTSQQNISKIIKQLEDEIGTTLIYRDRKGVDFTSEGKQLLEFAVKTVREYNAVLDSINPNRAVYSNIKGQVRIYSCKSAMDIFIDEFSETIINKMPNMKINIYTNSILQVIDEVCGATEPSIGVTAIFEDDVLKQLYPNLKNINSIPLIEDEYMCAMSSKSPLVRHKMISVKNLSDYKLVLPNDELNGESVFKKMFLLYGFDESNIIYAHNRKSYLQYIHNNFNFFGIASKKTMSKETDFSLLGYLPFKEKMKYHLSLIYPKNRILSKEQAVVTEYIRKLYEEIQ